MLENYLPILIFIIIGILFGVVPVILGWLIGPKRAYKAKNDAYECGFPAFEDARMPFNVRFYLVAILFIIFDLEVTFFIPWAIALTEIGWFGFWAMMVFLVLLTIGFIYEWKKGALEWE